jgi:bifunctional non-homologous end joining protein LigD
MGHAMATSTRGDARADAGGRRFVVQEHHATRLHWDLRLERDGVLVSWAIPNGLPLDPSENRKAVHVEDHPLEYLDFEGEIPEGSYGAGRVTIWDRGTYVCERWEPGKVVVRFEGARLRGRYALFRAGSERDWIIHRMDPPEDAAREPMPERIVPMLARLAPLPADDAGWAYEIKWDGIRAIAYSRPGRLRLETRNLNEVTGRYPELRGLNAALSHHEAVLDGEIVAFDERGRPSFERLQRRMHLTGEATIRRMARELPVIYVAFDLLHLDGRSLMDRPYEERRTRLLELELQGERWRTPAHQIGDGRRLLDVARDQGLEGIVAKRVDSRYEPGRRSGAWLKIKNTRRQELVIGGWVPGEGRRRDRIGALLVGYYADGELRFAGKVGTGFDEAELARLAHLLAPLRRDTDPFTGPPRPRNAVWVEPRLVAEIEFTELTSQNMLRHPSYKGLRTDKDPADVRLEHADEPPAPPEEALLAAATPTAAGLDTLLRQAPQQPGGRVEIAIEGHRVRLSTLDRVIYPASGFTKADVIDYYARISPVLLPHLHGRPLTLKRYPEGVDGPHFYEKQCPEHRPSWVRTAPVFSHRKGADIEFCLVMDLPTLIWAANLGNLELHTSLSLAEDLDRPTVVAFDLDPGEPATIVECCEVALALHGMLEQLGLESLAKTSGSKGLQVYAPLNHPKARYEQTKPFAKAVAETLERGLPDLVVSRMTKRLRHERVLVDWSQNDAAKSTVCVYSLRAREHPSASTPVTWDEVRACREARDPAHLTFAPNQVLARADEHGDLFAPVLTLVQELPRIA